MAHRTDLDARIAAHLDGVADDAPDVELQARAVLVDADLDDEGRAEAFFALATELLARLDPHQLGRCTDLAQRCGPGAAMAYLTTLQP